MLWLADGFNGRSAGAAPGTSWAQPFRTGMRLIRLSATARPTAPCLSHKEAVQNQRRNSFLNNFSDCGNRLVSIWVGHNPSELK